MSGSNTALEQREVGTCLGGPSPQSLAPPWNGGADVLKRALACALIILLPQNALEEAFSWLVDAWQFYSHETSGVDQPPLHASTLGILKPPMARAPLSINEE